MRRPVLVLALLVLSGAPAGAHTGFVPDQVAPGSIVTVTLDAADERDAAAMSKVELYFPEGVEVGARDATTEAPGWAATVHADRVEWSGPPADGDQSFTVTLGPLPAEPGRLQFKVLQTYDNGDVDRWIEDFPAGGPEPEMPGPVLDLVPGAAGEVAPTLPVPTTEASTTTAPETTSTVGSSEPVPFTSDDDGDGSGSDGPLVIGLVVAVLVGTAAFFVWRRRA